MRAFGKISFKAAVYLFLYCPLIVVVVYSFNDSPRSLLWRGFTWNWYHILMNDIGLLRVAGNSIIIALLSASLATVLGTIAATALYKYRFTGRKMLLGLTFLLIIVPDIVLAIALLILYNTLSVPLGFGTLLLAHIAFCVPFVTILVHSKLNELNADIFAAAKDLGAKDSTIFLKILLPLITPGLVSGWLISLTLSLDDVMISFFTTGPNFEILPLRIYSMARLGVSPEVNALCSIMLIVTLFTVVLSQVVFRKAP